MASQSVFLGTRPATRAPVLPFGRGAHGGCPNVCPFLQNFLFNYMMKTETHKKYVGATMHVGAMHNHLWY